MPARYSAGVLSSVTTTAAAALELRAPANQDVWLLELGMWITSGLASTFGIGRPAALGVTPGGTTTVQAEDTTGTGLTVIATTWATGPTVPAAFFKRFLIPAATGNGIIWTWGPDGLRIPHGASVVVWNLAANSAFNAEVVVRE